MKQIYVIIIGLMLSLPITAQITVGTMEPHRMGGGHLQPEDIAALKKTTTIFIVGNESAGDERKLIEQAFKNSWTITPYKVVSIDDGAEYKDKEGYSVFSYKKEDYAYSSGRYYYIMKLHYYQLTCKVGKHKKTFANIEMNEKNDSETNFPNTLQPGYLQCYLKIVNNYLVKNKVLETGKIISNDEALKNLKTETLYVPEYLLPEPSKKNGKKEEKDPKEKMMAKYEYPYEFKTGKELSDMILKDDKGISFFVYIGITGSSMGWVCVFNSKLDEIVFSDTIMMGFDAAAFKNLGYRISTRH